MKMDDVVQNIAILDGVDMAEIQGRVAFTDSINQPKTNENKPLIPGQGEADCFEDNRNSEVVELREDGKKSTTCDDAMHKNVNSNEDDGGNTQIGHCKVEEYDKQIRNKNIDSESIIAKSGDFANNEIRSEFSESISVENENVEIEASVGEIIRSTFIVPEEIVEMRYKKAPVIDNITEDENESSIKKKYDNTEELESTFKISKVEATKPVSKVATEVEEEVTEASGDENAAKCEPKTDLIQSTRERKVEFIDCLNPFKTNKNNENEIPSAVENQKDEKCFECDIVKDIIENSNGVELYDLTETEYKNTKCVDDSTEDFNNFEGVELGNNEGKGIPRKRIDCESMVADSVDNESELQRTLNLEYSGSTTEENKNVQIEVSEVTIQNSTVPEEAVDMEYLKPVVNNSLTEDGSESLKRKSDDSEEPEPNLKISKLDTTETVTEAAEVAVEITDENVIKSELNAGLIQTILQNSDTSNWEGKLHKPYELHELSSGSSEFQTVKQKFDATSPTRMSLTRIQRVENPFLLGMYLLKKEKMERTLRVEERSLFHGTKEANIDGICRFNFDWRRKGQSRGHLFGQGVSFSPIAAYAHHYTGGDHVIFLAKVLVSKTVEGHPDMVIPPESYDTTQKPNGEVIVKYDDDDFYPQYIIHYNYREWVDYESLWDDDSDDDC